MFQSPITLFETERQVIYENELLKVVQGYGFDVNKEELTKALLYDRGQYDKGYKDGYAKAIDEFVREIEEYYFKVVDSPFMPYLKNVRVVSETNIRKVAEQLKECE